MIEKALKQGVTAHKDGKLQDAERLYRTILQSYPEHPSANHNLGILLVSVNKAAAALPFFKTALGVNPKIKRFWLSYIGALSKEKQFDNAKKVLEEAKFIHTSMYVTLSGIAILGLGIGFLFCLGYQKNSYLIEFTIWSHELFFSTAIWLISLHVLAAIYHRIRHDFVWSSMVPFKRKVIRKESNE
ncbi:cytochrome b/b6 domain-containing protein [Paracoccaceae bacterium]|nr:cytochrome b/b6 domain-containing protein [Paracoccaceae bacterium]